MKFIIKSNAKIPGFGGIRGPILTPQEKPAKKAPIIGTKINTTDGVALDCIKQ